MALVVGLTGGIGSGKSAAADLFVELGAGLVDTDVISRQLTVPDAPAVREVAALLGKEFLTADGGLDRALLRQRVFSDESARKTLEGILHPRIRLAVLEGLADCQALYAVVAIPLLFESDGQYHGVLSRILVVDCREETQIARTMARSGLSASEVRAIMARQASRELRLGGADDVIDNDGDRENLRRQVLVLHDKYLALGK